MKFYGLCHTASISMVGDDCLRKILPEVLKKESIKYVIETGTFIGLGSTTLIAESFSEDTPPDEFVTIEASFLNWRKAKRNLTKYPFISPLWGKSVKKGEALTFIENDEMSNQHQKL